MSGDGKSAEFYAGRIASVLRFHGILFDTGEYESLLDFAGDPRREKLLRVLSVVRAHAIMLQDGYLRRDGDAAEEISGMLRYLNGLLDVSPPELKKTGMIPRNLGSSFVKRGFGFPLFGYYRPDTPPEEPGVLLYYHSPDGDGASRFEGEEKTGSTVLAYSGLGVSIDSGEPRMFCVVSPDEQAPVLIPFAAFDKPEPDCYYYPRYSVTMAAGKIRAGARVRVLDPQAYQFAYFFPAGPDTEHNVSRFLKDILAGRFGIPQGEAENMGWIFSGRLLGT